MESIYLVGSEDVRHAAASIRQSANDMLRASSQISEAQYAFKLWAEDFLSRLELILKEKNQ